MIYVDFNSLGVVSDVDTSEESLRQGSVGIVLSVYFQGVTNNLNYTATFNFTRSDRTKITNVAMSPDSYDATNPNYASSYNYKFNDEWYFAKAGTTTLTIFLRDGSGNIAAQGQVQFSIEETDYDDDPETITTEQYDSLVALITAQASNYVTVDSTEQTIEGVKTFANGIEIGSTPIKLEEGSLGELVFDSSIRPSTSNSKTLGYPSYVWNVVYANSLIDSNANALLFQSNLPKFKEQGSSTYSFMLNEKNETISGLKTFNNGLVVGASKDLVVAEGEIWSLNETLFAIGAYEDTKTHYAFPQGGVPDNPHDYEHPLIIATEDYVSTYAYAKSYIDNNFVPIVEVTTSTELTTLTGNPKILKIGSNYFIAKIIAQRLGITNTYNYYFEIESLIDKTRYAGSIEIGMAGLTLGDVMTSTYEKDYAVADNYYTKAQVVS